MMPYRKKITRFGYFKLYHKINHINKILKILQSKNPFTINRKKLKLLHFQTDKFS